MVRWRSVGTSILSFFGGLWFFWGVSLLQIPHGGLWLAGAGILCGAIVIASVYDLRHARRPSKPLSVEQAAEAKRRGRMFNIINAVQWIAIFVAANILRNLDRGQMLPLFLSLIVGLHFLPLASVFRRRRDLWIGASILVVDAAAFFWPPPSRYGVAALGTGAVLIAFAAWTVSSLPRVLARERPASMAA